MPPPLPPHPSLIRETWKIVYYEIVMRNGLAHSHQYVAINAPANENENDEESCLVLECISGVAGRMANNNNNYSTSTYVSYRIVMDAYKHANN